MKAIPNTTVTATYDGATFSFGDVFESGFVVVANNPVVMQLAQAGFGQSYWGPEMFIAPATIPLIGGSRNPISGIRFKQASATSPAPQVFGALFYKGEPSIVPGAALTQAISPTGGVTSNNPYISDIANGPPANPSHGQIWIANNITSSSDGSVISNGAWTFYYNANSPSSFKWEFIGGYERSGEITASDTVNSATYADAAHGGPSVTAPRAGDYIVRTSAFIGSNNTGVNVFMSYAIGGTGAVDADAIGITTPGGITSVINISAHWQRIKAGLSAGTILFCKYRADGANNCFVSGRTIALLPIRVS